LTEERHASSPASSAACCQQIEIGISLGLIN
jgi:hypothetical protein